jgi:3-methyladenine DNA glycosylase AlkD
MGQTLDVLWWKLFEGSGQEVSLEEVREWIEERRKWETADTVSDESTDAAGGLW